MLNLSSSHTYYRCLHSRLKCLDALFDKDAICPQPNYMKDEKTILADNALTLLSSNEVLA